MTASRDEPLPAIPVLDLGVGGAMALFEAERERAKVLLASGRRNYPAALVGWGDRRSQRWLARNASPYGSEVRAIAQALGEPGAAFLNVSYEWGCTVGLAPAPSGGMRLLRALDWPFEGLGANVVAARFEAPTGPWVNLTWPGFVGCVQGSAPGRFAACFNQAPLRSRSGLFVADWALERLSVWRSRAMPPAHLLRLVFETCPDFAAAKAMLSETPIALPALFVLCGTQTGEACVIERLQGRSFVHDEARICANHWLTAGLGGRARGTESERRAATLAGRLGDAGPDLAWLVAPILNQTTRLALVAEPASGHLTALGIEAEAPATAVLSLKDGGQRLRPTG